MRALEPEVFADLVRRCAAIELETIGADGRAHFLGLVRELCEETDIEVPLS